MLAFLLRPVFAASRVQHVSDYTAFDRVDHFALLQQLMDRNIPRMAIGVLLDWLQKSFVCNNFVKFRSP